MWPRMLAKSGLTGQSKRVISVASRPRVETLPGSCSPFGLSDGAADFGRAVVRVAGCHRSNTLGVISVGRQVRSPRSSSRHAT